MDKDKNAAMALLHAVKKGMFVDRKGHLYGIRGARRILHHNRDGYARVRTWVPLINQYTNIMVHQLQAYQKFGDKLFKKGIQVRHLNGDRADNRWENIDIGTAYDNAMDRSKEARKKHALNAASYQRKLTDDQVRELRRLRKEGAPYKRLTKMFDISKGNVSDIVNFKLYKNVN